MRRPSLPSPAMVIACGALAISLSGVAYAASLPRNSVGTPQLRANAVTGPKVRNRSLRAVDFARGQLPRGPRGLRGLIGATGTTGAPGATGATGPRGLSDAWFRGEPGSVTLPAGNYVVLGQVYAQAGMLGQQLTCTIEGGSGDVSGGVADVPAVSETTVVAFASLTLSAPGSVFVACESFTGTLIRAITAVQVATRN